MNDELPAEPARRPERVRGHAAARSLLVVAAALSVVAALLSPAPAAQAAPAAPVADAAPASLRPALSITPAASTTAASDSLSPAPAARVAVARWLAASGVFAAAPGVVALAQPGGFGDVAGDAYYSEPVAALAAMGVFGGTECDAGFCPDEAIDRKTMAVWVVRVLDGSDPTPLLGTGSRFDDVNRIPVWWVPFIERMAELGVTQGCGDGTNFCPNDFVTRAQMAVFLSRAYNLAAGPDPGFSDVSSDAWYAADVARLAASGITEGCGDGTVFCPRQDTTRAQMATFLHRGSRWAVDREAAAVAASRAELSAVPGEAVVTPHRGQVSVSWPATEALAGSPVAGYEVQWRARGEAWDPARRAVVIGLSYEVGGLSGGVHEVRVRPAVVERAEVAGASIVSAQGSAPTAALVAPSVAVDEASNVSAFDGVVHFEMTGEPVWPATIELPVDMAKIEDDDFVFLMSFNEEYQVWLPEPGAVFDHERGVVTAEVYHLSNWFTKKLEEGKSLVSEGASVIGSTIEEVSSDFLDTLVGGVEPVVSTIDKGAKAVKYVWDDGVVYVAEKGRTYVVNTYATTRDVALAAARATWEAAKWVAATGWDAFVELVEEWVVDRFTLTELACSDTEPGWVTSVETPEKDVAALIVCAEAVGVTSEQDLRLKVASQRHYPMLLTARDAASSKIKISPTNDDTSRVRVEQTEGSSTLADVTVAWFDAAFDTGQPVLPAGATHWLRIPRSALKDPPSMTLEGRYDGSAANLNTAMMGVELLADIYTPISPGDVSQLHGLSNEAAECFSRGYTTTSTQQQRWRSFSETTTCLAPIYLQALASKVLSPMIFLLEGIVQLAGYLEALADIATGQDTPTTTIHATPSNDNTQPDTTAPAPAPTTAFNAVTAGRDHTCALRTDATITCWGYNGYGEADAPNGTFNAVTASGNHTCGLRTDATITCWGYNGSGQADAPNGTFNAVTAGLDHTCALRTDATITCWGYNGDGQADAPNGTFNAVTAGWRHTCGLKTDATITCWGHNDYGQADAPNGTYNAVTTGFYHTCALRTDATITCWGWNDYGQADAPNGTFNAVTAGYRQTCALRTDATITCWGFNGDGLADAPNGTFNAVTAGWRHTCGLRTDATITCWGHNGYGQADAPNGTFGPAGGSGPTVTVTKGGPGPTVLGPGLGVACGADTPTCRYLDVGLRGFAAGTYTVSCSHDGWGTEAPSTFWTFTVTVGESGSASRNGPCFINFAKLTANGAYVTVSRTGTTTVRSNWLK